MALCFQAPDRTDQNTRIWESTAVPALDIKELFCTTQPLTGIEQLHEIKEETTKRWKESGLLDGLTDGIPDNLAKMLESKDSFIINKENEIFTRIHVIDILNEFAFFLSDNGDPDTTGKEWLDMQYPEK